MISLVVSGSIDVFKLTNHSHPAAIHKSEFPSLPTFYKDLNETRGRPSDEVCNILLHILEVGQEPFLDSPPSSSQYAAPTADVLAFSVTSKADWNCKLFCLQKTTQ